MKINKLILYLIFGTYLGINSKDMNQMGQMRTEKTGCITNSEFELRQAMRKLWMDHVIWTHEYIMSNVLNIPNLKLVTKRLLKNQDDIGKAIAPIYGEDAGLKLAKLLKEHILIAADLVNAAKKDQADLVKNIDKKWHKNAEDIAIFLNNANKNWPTKDLIHMLNQHLDLTTKEALAVIKKEWKRLNVLYDEVQKQILSMADDLSIGIIKQFPDKFK